MIISMDVEKAFDKIQHLSLIKKFHELRLEGNASKLRRASTNQTKASKQANNEPTNQTKP